MLEFFYIKLYVFIFIFSLESSQELHLHDTFVITVAGKLEPSLERLPVLAFDLFYHTIFCLFSNDAVSGIGCILIDLARTRRSVTKLINHIE